MNSSKGITPISSSPLARPLLLHTMIPIPFQTATFTTLSSPLISSKKCFSQSPFIASQLATLYTTLSLPKIYPQLHVPLAPHPLPLQSPSRRRQNPSGEMIRFSLTLLAPVDAGTTTSSILLRSNGSSEFRERMVCIKYATCMLEKASQ